MRRFVWVLAAVALVAVVAIGLVQAGSNDPPEPAQVGFDLAEARRSLEGSPAPLAALHEQSAALLEGGPEAFEARLEELRGYPVVINKWGSWCGPCRSEFPIFQQVAAEKGRTVAFLGINGMDPLDSAEQFLSEFPVPFPSYVDPRDAVADVVRAAGPFPITAFVRPDGEVEIAIARQYETAAQLRDDIKKYLKA